MGKIKSCSRVHAWRWLLTPLLDDFAVVTMRPVWRDNFLRMQIINYESVYIHSWQKMGVEIKPVHVRSPKL